MIVQHPLRRGERAFESEIARHSGDEVRVFKKAKGQELLLSFHYPAGYDPAGRYPLFVFVHGGGWQGRKVFPDQEAWSGDYLGFLARYYADRGFLCAGIDYRLMREGGQAAGYEMMDLLEDCMDAVEYLKDHADELGADLDRAAVTGESAGGHLAGMLATQTDFFKTAVLVNPVTDFTDEKWNPLLPVRPRHPALKGVKRKDVINLFSPARQVRPGTCPTLILHGARDTVVNPKHAQAFCDAMTECGNEAALHWIEDTDHAFLLAEYMKELNRPLDAANIAVDVIDEWLKTHI